MFKLEQAELFGRPLYLFWIVIPARSLYSTFFLRTFLLVGRDGTRGHNEFIRVVLNPLDFLYILNLFSENSGSAACRFYKWGYVFLYILSTQLISHWLFWISLLSRSAYVALQSPFTRIQSSTISSSKIRNYNNLANQWFQFLTKAFGVTQDIQIT